MTVIELLRQIVERHAMRRVEGGTLTDEQIENLGIALVELLTIKIRLIVASVDKAKEIGMDWWENDPYLSSKGANNKALEEENKMLHERLKTLEEKIETKR